MIFKYPIKAYFKGLVPLTPKQMTSAPWYQVDLFRCLLKFRCPHPTYQNSSGHDWYQPPFVDTYTLGSMPTPDDSHGKKNIMMTGWQFKPNVHSDNNCIVLKLSVNVECLSKAEQQLQIDLTQPGSLLPWVKSGYQEKQAQAAMYDMFMGTDGTMAIEFNDKETVQQRISDSTLLGEIVKTIEIGKREWIYFQVGSDMYYYTPLAKEDALCFRYNLTNIQGFSLPLDNTVNDERLTNINIFIMAMLNSVNLLPSQRLKKFLKNKGIKTRH